MSPRARASRHRSKHGLGILLVTDATGEDDEERVDREIEAPPKCGPLVRARRVKRGDIDAVVVAGLGAGAALLGNLLQVRTQRDAARRQPAVDDHQGSNHGLTRPRRDGAHRDRARAGSGSTRPAAGPWCVTTGTPRRAPTRVAFNEPRSISCDSTTSNPETAAPEVRQRSQLKRHATAGNLVHLKTRSARGHTGLERALLVGTGRDRHREIADLTQAHDEADVRIALDEEEDPRSPLDVVRGTPQLSHFYGSLSVDQASAHRAGARRDGRPHAAGRPGCPDGR